VSHKLRDDTSFHLERRSCVRKRGKRERWVEQYNRRQHSSLPKNDFGLRSGKALSRVSWYHSSAQ
jgi:hypothetical protein